MFRVWHQVIAFESPRLYEMSIKDSEVNTYSDALVIAEMLATDHAKEIDVSVSSCEQGFTFRTNGGSTVSYVVKSI